MTTSTGRPVPPLPPRHRSDLAPLHAVLVLITCGLWAPFWILIARNTARYNRFEHERYEREVMEYGERYDAWADRYDDPRVWL